MYKGVSFLMEVDSSSLKRSISMDISVFYDFLKSAQHKSTNFLLYKDFRAKWDEIDLDLLTHFASTETIISSLVNLGLFSAIRPFRDHQILVFFLFSLYRCTGKALKITVDRMQVLVGVKLRAGMMSQGEGEETLAALETLFQNDAIIIIAEDPFTSRANPTVSISPGTIDLIQDRIKRIELFLVSHPLFLDQKFHRSNILRIRSLFDRYHDAKLKAGIVLEKEQDFGTVISGLLRIIEGYEKLTSIVSQYPTTLPVSKSIRSRLSQSSLTPIATNFASSAPSLTSQDFFTEISRSQSVPPARIRRTSGLRDVEMDEFRATNMPDINFY